MKTRYHERFSRLKMKMKEKKRRNFDDKILLSFKGDDEGEAAFAAKIESNSH